VLAVMIDSASAHECRLVDEAPASNFLDALCEKLIGDKAYEWDPLGRRLDEEPGIEINARNRENRSQTQHGRDLGRYLRDWDVEQMFA